MTCLLVFAAARPVRAEDSSPPVDPLAAEVWLTPTALVPQAGTRTLRVEGALRFYFPPGTRDEYPGMGLVAFSYAPADGIDLRAAANVLPVSPELGPFDLQLGPRLGLKRAGRLRVATFAAVHVAGYIGYYNTYRHQLGGEVGAALTGCVDTACASAVSLAGILTAVSTSDKRSEGGGPPNESSARIGTTTINGMGAIGPRLALFGAGILCRSSWSSSSSSPSSLGSVYAPSQWVVTAGARLMSPRDGVRRTRTAVDVMATFVSMSYPGDVTSPHRVGLLGIMWSTTWEGVPSAQVAPSGAPR